MADQIPHPGPSEAGTRTNQRSDSEPADKGLFGGDRKILLDDPTLYLNPELSLLQFQRRVLEEACDPRNPLLERVKFLSIVSSNLDEFFMVRVAGLLQQIESGVQELSIDGKPAGAQLEAIRAEVAQIIAEAYATYLRNWFRPLLKPGL